jgi:hypothetical protein
MFWPKGMRLVYNLNNLFIFFSTTLRTRFKLPHLSIVSILQCVCTHPINPMGIHFLRCAHGNECTETHDAIHDTFAAIVQDVSFHVGWKQSHVLLSTTFNSSCWQVNIVFTKNGICTLADVVIVDSTWTYLLPRSYTTQGFLTKERSYHNPTPP